MAMVCDKLERAAFEEPERALIGIHNRDSGIDNFLKERLDTRGFDPPGAKGVHSDERGSVGFELGLVIADGLLGALSLDVIGCLASEQIQETLFALADKGSLLEMGGDHADDVAGAGDERGGLEGMYPFFDENIERGLACEKRTGGNVLDNDTSPGA